MSTSLLAFVACPPGIEATLAQELAQLELTGQITAGGVLVRCRLWALRRLLERSRVAHSVRVRLKAFQATDFAALEAGLVRLPWHAYLEPAACLAFRVSCRRSRLYHSKAVEERVARSLQRYRSAGLPDDDHECQRVYVRVDHDWVQVSIDASGPLYRRGYRTHVAVASLRETLAAVAARLLLHHAPEVGQVWDPFCGSGVLPLEWHLARSGRVAQQGPFPMDRWPIARGMNAQRNRADSSGGAAAAEGADGVALWLSDVNPRALAAAQHNAKNAGLFERCRFLEMDFEAAAAQVPVGAAVLCNPPYGVRLGDERTARRTLARFEQQLRARSDLRPALVLAPWHALGQYQRLRWKRLVQFPNGGLQISAHWLA